MVLDSELEKMSISDLQQLAAGSPENLNQIVKILNDKNIDIVNIHMDNKIEKVYQRKGFQQKMRRKLTKLEAYKKYSIDYQAKKRAVGPDSWFYEFLTPDTWNEYEISIKKQMEE
jgi:hypothetical protein